jgi:Na+/H+ antiporter NhaD/arsenite permease-like protein
MDMIALAILLLVFVLIAVRQIGNVRMQIWQIMLGGAIAAVVTMQISFSDALAAINAHVIVFLFCMFLLGQALEQSGYLSYLSYHLFRRAKSADALLWTILLVMGLGSSLLMNDTLAIVGTPVMLMLARKHKMSAKLLLLALCFAITIGSVMSPIGNPQNLLIAFEVANPFLMFFKYLFVPTIISLGAAYLLLRICYPGQFHSKELIHDEIAISDPALARYAQYSLLLLLLLIALKIIMVFAGFDFPMTLIAVIAVIPVLLARRIDVVKSIDWRTLVFFAAMFVLMQAVWDSGVLQMVLSGVDVANISSIFLISILASQLISNVPLVALYLPLLQNAHVAAYMALAAASTIAGNLFILGAASNVIVIQNAEKHGETITFWEFARVGVPLTLLCVLIYGLWIALLI